MGIHFIRLTDVQVGHLRDVLTDWDAGYNGLQGSETGNFIKALRVELEAMEVPQGYGFHDDHMPHQGQKNSSKIGWVGSWTK